MLVLVALWRHYAYKVYYQDKSHDKSEKHKDKGDDKSKRNIAH
jgi:hypothetical protein